MSPEVRRFVAIQAAVVVIMPALLLYGIKRGAEGIALCCDWLVCGRRWSAALDRTVTRLHRWGDVRSPSCEGTIITKKSTGDA